MRSETVHLTERLDEVRAHLRSGDLALLLDFDGTLAPIVDRAGDAEARPASRAAVRRLARSGCRIAVISGRALADVRDRLGLEGIVYAGNHGLEIEGPGVRRLHPEAERARGALDRARARIEERLDGIPGAWVEDKRLSLSVHHRETPAAHHAEVERAVRESVESEALEIRPGKRVWEVRPRVDWDKGRAVEFLLDAWGDADAWPLYLGDDVTDEDAFHAVLERGLGVRVGRESGVPTAARGWLADPAEVERFLVGLADGMEP